MDGGHVQPWNWKAFQNPLLSGFLDEYTLLFFAG